MTGRITSQVTSKLSYIEVVTRDGGKWYFDGYGKWFPDGYTPTVKLEIKNNSVAISSSDLYSRVIVHLSDGSTQEWSTSAYSGTYKPFKSLTLVAVAIVLKSDGSKWYFDAYGALQPLSSKWYTDVD